MLKQNILIFGSNGMLGKYCESYFSNIVALKGKKYNIIPIVRADFDIINVSQDSLLQLLKSHNIGENDVVINCAGVIPQSSATRELTTKSTFIVNSIFPILVSNVCNQLNANFIHITTDCVFNGKDSSIDDKLFQKSGLYTEESCANETSDYGMSKSLGEYCSGTIIRTSIIGEELINKRSLLEWVRSNKNKSIKGYSNHMWNGVTCLQLAKIIEQIIYMDKYWDGVCHVYSPISVSKYELVEMISEIYELNCIIEPMETPVSINKTISSVYPLNKQLHIPHLYTQIQEMEQYDLK